MSYELRAMTAFDRTTYKLLKILGEFDSYSLFLLIYSCNDGPSLEPNGLILAGKFRREEQCDSCGVFSTKRLPLGDLDESPSLAQIDTGALKGAIQSNFGKLHLKTLC